MARSSAGRSKEAARLARAKPSKSVPFGEGKRIFNAPREGGCL